LLFFICTGEQIGYGNKRWINHDSWMELINLFITF
jgi:hypothetical protein